MSQELTKRILSSIILIPTTLFFIIKGSFLFIFFLLICLSLTSYEWHIMSKKKTYSIFGFIFLFISFYTIYRLRIDNDYLFILLITLICVSTDIGGYVFGKIFKGPKLTKFSPNKTYAGMIGGFLLSIISIIIFNYYYFTQDFKINFFSKTNKQ